MTDVTGTIDRLRGDWVWPLSGRSENDNVFEIAWERAAGLAIPPVDYHIGHRWIGQFISPEYALISARNAKNASGYSSIRQGPCKIDLRAAGTPIEPGCMPYLSGKNSTRQNLKNADCCIRQES